MPLLRVTVDTGPWLDLLDRRGCVAEMDRMLRWHQAGRIQLFASSRVLHPDTDAMDPDQREQLQLLLDRHKIEIAGALFRHCVSRHSGPDLHSGPPARRTPEALKRFVEVVGPDPPTLPPSSVGKTFSRKVGDYDALHTHFATGNDVFVTLDTKDYLRIFRRGDYRSELGLIVQAPAEFVSAFEADIQIP